MAVILVRQKFALHQNGDIRSVELLVHNCTIADIAAQTQIALDQRGSLLRQAR